MAEQGGDSSALSGTPPFMDNANWGSVRGGHGSLALLNLDGGSKRPFRLPGVVGASLDERGRWKAVERGREVQWNEQQRAADFLSVVQDMPLGNCVKAPTPSAAQLSTRTSPRRRAVTPTICSPQNGTRTAGVCGPSG